MSSEKDPLTTAASDFRGLATGFILQTAITLGLLIAFSILRPNHKVVYEPKSKFAPEKKRPDPLPNAIYSWATRVVRINEVPLMDKIGLDAVMFLRFMRLCLNFITGLTLVGLLMLIMHFFAPRFTGTVPKSLDEIIQEQRGANATGGIFKYFNPQLDVISMGNVAPDSPWFFVHSGLAWIYSLWAYYLLWTTWTEFIQLRRRWFASEEFRSSYHNKTILMTQLPEDLQSEQALQKFLQKLQASSTTTTAVVAGRPGAGSSGSSVKHVALGRNVTKLPKLVAEHEKYTTLLEKTLAKYLADPNRLPSKRPKHREGSVPFTCGLIGGQQVDTIEFCTKRIRELEKEIYALRAKGDSQYKPNAAAFASFDTMAAAHSFAKKYEGNGVTISHRTGHQLPPRIKLSPSFDEIIWSNIGMPIAARKTRQLIAVGIVMALTVGWTSIITFVSTLTNIETIGQLSVKFAKYLEARPELVVFIQSVLAPVLLAVLNLMLPFVLRILARFQGVSSTSGVEKSVLYKNFFFMVYQFLFLVFFSSVWKVLSDKAAADTTQANVNFGSFVFRSAANGIVTYAAFYCTLIATGFTQFAIEIIQLAPFLLSFFKRKLSFLTPRQEFDLNQPPRFDFTLIYSVVVVAFMQCATYSLIAPIILPFGLMFFAIAYVVMKYQLVYVYETRNETGGSWWPKMFNLLCFCVGMMQVSTGLGIWLNARLKADEGAEGRYWRWQVAMVAVLPFVTGGFWFYVRRTLGVKGRYLTDFAEEETVGGAAQVTGGRVSGKTPLMGTGGLDDDDETLDLSDRVFDPSLAKPLWKVWVWKRSRPVWDQMYNPEYSDLADYIRKTRPAPAKTATQLTTARSVTGTMTSTMSHQVKPAPVPLGYAYPPGTMGGHMVQPGGPVPPYPYGAPQPQQPYTHTLGPQPIGYAHQGPVPLGYAPPGAAPPMHYAPAPIPADLQDDPAFSTIARRAARLQQQELASRKMTAYRVKAVGGDVYGSIAGRTSSQRRVSSRLSRFMGGAPAAAPAAQQAPTAAELGGDGGEFDLTQELDEYYGGPIVLDESTDAGAGRAPGSGASTAVGGTPSASAMVTRFEGGEYEMQTRSQGHVQGQRLGVEDAVSVRETGSMDTLIPREGRR
ncbi:hypothetical protein HK102_004373 [Quaeritorhiza haematococci]|nr:hypothetical protein HK102_004373 [Quaeritorhiza haematococci]